MLAGIAAAYKVPYADKYAAYLAGEAIALDNLGDFFATADDRRQDSPGGVLPMTVYHIDDPGGAHSPQIYYQGTYQNGSPASGRYTAITPLQILFVNLLTGRECHGTC